MSPVVSSVLAVCSMFVTQKPRLMASAATNPLKLRVTASGYRFVPCWENSDFLSELPVSKMKRHLP